MGPRDYTIEWIDSNTIKRICSTGLVENYCTPHCMHGVLNLVQPIYMQTKEW